MKLTTKILYSVLLLLPAVASAQSVGIKTNLFYGGYTQTPNLGVEFGLGSRSTLDIGAGYNPWNLDGKKDANGVVYDNKKLVHVLGAIEYRYWLCERFNGHFFGVHGLGSQYNVAEYELPLLFGEGSKGYRFEGWAAGAGISYGYQFILGRSWNLEATVGFGFAVLQYDKYDCPKCGEFIDRYRRDYIGPTRAGISLIYVF